MRAHVALAVSLSSIAGGAGLVACIDLFHSTSDILSLCQLDGQVDGCGLEAGVDASEAGSDGGAGFCAWSPTEARANAQHACAWLGACESPMGDNAFGGCMFQALLAYDCSANPNHRVQGSWHDRWDCLRQVKSCADVDRCVLPTGHVTCGSGGDYTACGTAEVRVECTDGGAPHLENCTLWGQGCASDGTQGLCAGATGDAGLSCDPRLGCTGTALHFCHGNQDVGLDCAGNGAGQCAAFGNGQWVACVADSDAGACAPDPSVSCQNGIAVSCPSGVTESINCEQILQVASACNPQDAAPPFDWTSACAVVPPQPPCDGDAGESCDDAGALTSCARGAPFTVHCADEGLGACQLVDTDNGSAQHAACTPP